MSTPEWILLAIGVGVIVIIFQLSGIRALLAQSLGSIDAEVFHLAQEQNPTYGVCSMCQRRATVRHVVPENPAKDQSDEEETFYCKACWWMSRSMRAADDELHYKDRLTEEDRRAQRFGPG